MKFVVTFIILFCCLHSFGQTSDSYGDNDGDGVRNSFDKCPKTLKGVDVDTHGCPRDTDGDGVADYLDKQLITPTECQPSDADGIGVCPIDPKCDEFFGIRDAVMWSPEYIGFSYYSTDLDSNAIEIIKKVAHKMRSSPNFPIIIKGFVFNLKSKKELNYSLEKIHRVKQELVIKHDIEASRIYLSPNNIGQLNLVKIQDPDSYTNFEELRTYK